jgi:hypothetical protein
MMPSSAGGTTPAIPQEHSDTLFTNLPSFPLVNVNGSPDDRRLESFDAAASRHALLSLAALDFTGPSTENVTVDWSQILLSLDGSPGMQGALDNALEEF